MTRDGTLERRTVDGVQVRIGDHVWIDEPGLGVRHKRMTMTSIYQWWDTFYAGKAYASEHACIKAAIVTRKRQVAKARRDIRTATAYADKLRARLATIIQDERASERNVH